MKKLLLLLSVLICYNAYSQDTDTVLYSNHECNEPIGNQDIQSISFALESDTLTITGKIIANCCGIHFMTYEIYPDSIYLSRLDTGDLCDCYCLQNINLKIGNCTSNTYKLYLSEYSGNDGIDTIIVVNQTSILDNSFNEKKNKCLPNPFNETAIIEFPNQKSLSFTFTMFDYTGNTAKIINNIKSDKLLIEKGALKGGIYFYSLYNSDNQRFYSGKLVIQ